MNTRERYHAVARFEPGVQTLRWEFGYWVGTIERWYQEGLQRTSYSPPHGMPIGSGVVGEAAPFPLRPSLMRYRDVDVHNLFGLDDGLARIPINWRFSPPLEEKVLEEDETSYLMINSDGVTVRVRKDSDSVPHFLDWPVRDRTSWEQVKQEHFGPDVMARLPNRWETLFPTYHPNRDYPLGVVMDGFFSMPRELIGVQRQLMMYYDDPRLMHDINDHLCKTWLAVLEEVISRVDLDCFYIWEDMAFKNGPLISPAMFKEFISPYYRRVIDLLKARGVSVICVDTDGDCWKLIPRFLEAGVTGLYPFEVQAGMNVVEVRKQYPQLIIMGGLDKSKVAQGKQAIDDELDSKLPLLLPQGGCIPFCDHLVPPDVSWENFCYYRQKLNQYIEQYSSR